MALTNTSTILFGNLFQIGNGIFGAGTTQVQTITFSGAPAAGAVTFGFWTTTITINTASGLPLGPAFQTTLNAAFGTAYASPFTVSLTGNIYTVTASTTGPFAFMPLPNFTTVANTSATTITYGITTPGVTQETFTTIKGVEVMPWPQPKRDVETYMTLDAGTNGYKRKITKFADAGNVKATIVTTNDATQDAISGLKYVFNSNLFYDWRIVEPTKTPAPGVTVPGSTYYFTAAISDFMRNGSAADARQKYDVSFEIDGSVNELPPLS